jgi:hypothetical protein
MWKPTRSGFTARASCNGTPVVAVRGRQQARPHRGDATNIPEQQTGIFGLSRRGQPVLACVELVFDILFNTIDAPEVGSLRQAFENGRPACGNLTLNP